MLEFLTGAVSYLLGAFTGIFIMALCAAGRDDK